MNKNQNKFDIFKKYIIKSNSIVGRIIDIDYKKQTGKFWIQEPKNLKNELAQGRHKPNIFYFHNITNVSYSPKIGDLITANIAIPNNTLLFYNIFKKNKYKTKRNNNRTTHTTKRRNNRKK